MPTVLIQGSDFKARKWSESIEADCYFFRSSSELLSQIKKLRGSKSVVFRYQNSQKSLLSDIRYTLTMIFILSLRRLLGLRIFWIMHNIDRETIDTYPLITKIRRRMLFAASEKVFVTDQMFKNMLFPDVAKVSCVSFGRKFGGQISDDSLSAIQRVREDVDIVVLCVGAAGKKYVHFNRLALLDAEARKNGKSLALILPDSVHYDGCAVVNIAEPNLDELRLFPTVDFIYRVNDDISMPFTIYAACSARIPLVSSKDFFTSKIIAEYGLGFTETDFAVATKAEKQNVIGNMDAFLSARSWSSLGEQIV